jgi:serine protease
LEVDSYQINDWYYLLHQQNVKKVVGLPGYDNAAWEITTGDTSVYIAILDQGLEPHEDLDSNKIWWGYDFADSSGFKLYTIPPWSEKEEHGMAVAGLIVARHNNLVPDSSPPKSGELMSFNSVAGVAPEARYYSVRVLDTSGNVVAADLLAEAIDFGYKNGAAIMNCSWGWAFDPVDNVDQKLDSAYYLGRNGRGVITVFSSGNRGQWDWYLLWPKYKSTVLAVGAIQPNDVRFPWSSYGDSLDLVAPSGERYSGQPTYTGGVWTTDRMGALGSNPVEYDECQPVNDEDYLCIGSGTSLSAPLVSGTAALVLARRPDLTAAQVFHVLRYSALTELQWGTVVPPDLEYGYGCVNALRALLAICRGDANNDAAINNVDIVYLINYYQGGPPPRPHPLMGDANCDGIVNLGDVVYLVNFIYHGGPAPQICFEY